MQGASSLGLRAQRDGGSGLPPLARPGAAAVWWEAAHVRAQRAHVHEVCMPLRSARACTRRVSAEARRQAAGHAPMPAGTPMKDMVPQQSACHQQACVCIGMCMYRHVYVYACVCMAPQQSACHSQAGADLEPLQVGARAEKCVLIPVHGHVHGRAQSWTCTCKRTCSCTCECTCAWA